MAGQDPPLWEGSDHLLPGEKGGASDYRGVTSGILVYHDIVYPELALRGTQPHLQPLPNLRYGD